MKKYEITKEQIVEIYEYCNNSELKNTIKAGWFPEAFKTALEVGVWYKRPHNKALFCIVGNPENEPFEVYGFDMSGNWMKQNEHTDRKVQTFKEDEVKATESEVFEALKNEAVKRGFVGNQFINIYDLGFVNDDLIIGGNLEWDGTYLNFGGKGTAIFHNGVWGSVVHSITKAEAEKLLNKKII